MLVRAVTTTNVHALPDRASESIAILPGGRIARAEARTIDGSWLLVVYPEGSTLRGWVPEAIVVATSGSVDALPTLSVTVESGGTGQGAGTSTGGLPDLTIADAFLLDDGRLALSIENIGQARLEETLVPLRVTAAEGEILGVLQIGPTTIEAGQRATVVTPVIVVQAGTYRLVLDGTNQIREADESNNARNFLLVPGATDE